MNDLPRSKVALIDSHLYISLRYAIGDFLGKGKCPAKIEFGNKGYIDKIVNSKLGREVFQRVKSVNSGVSLNNLLVIIGIQWSDDFDPKSSSKINRESVWMKTLTFLTEDSHKNMLEDTYPMMIGLKNKIIIMLRECLLKS